MNWLLILKATISVLPDVIALVRQRHVELKAGTAPSWSASQAATDAELARRRRVELEGAKTTPTGSAPR